MWRKVLIATDLSKASSEVVGCIGYCCIIFFWLGDSFLAKNGVRIVFYYPYLQL